MDFKSQQQILKEVQVPNAATRTQYLTSDPTIQAGPIVSVQSYMVGDMAASPFTTAALQADAVFGKSILNIVSTKNKTLLQVPLSDLRPASNAGVRMQFAFTENVDLSKCFIDVVTVAGLDAAKVFVLGFFLGR